MSLFVYKYLIVNKVSWDFQNEIGNIYNIYKKGKKLQNIFRA
mgnify:FL=1